MKYRVLTKHSFIKPDLLIKQVDGESIFYLMGSSIMFNQYEINLWLVEGWIRRETPQTNGFIGY